MSVKSSVLALVALCLASSALAELVPFTRSPDYAAETLACVNEMNFTQGERFGSDCSCRMDLPTLFAYFIANSYTWPNVTCQGRLLPRSCKFVFMHLFVLSPALFHFRWTQNIFIDY